MKYKWVLKKDLPWVKAGEVGKEEVMGEVKIFYFGKNFTGYSENELARLPDWFERVEDGPERWRAKSRETYFYLDEFFEWKCGVENFNPEFDNKRWKVGNYFKTDKQAEEFAQKFIEKLKSKLIEG